jgi:hypothetical protein
MFWTITAEAKGSGQATGGGRTRSSPYDLHPKCQLVDSDSARIILMTHSFYRGFLMSGQLEIRILVLGRVSTITRPLKGNLSTRKHPIIC